MPSFVPSYRVNPGGSVTYQETPVGSSFGTSAPQASQTAVEIEYQNFPASQSFYMPLVNFPVTMIKNAGTCGYGSRLLLTMPRAMTQFVAARVTLALTTAATGGLVTGAAVVGAMGASPAASTDATLAAAGEITYVGSTVCTLTAFVGAFTAVSATTQAAYVDDSAAGRNVYLNFACPGADIAGDCVLVCNGAVRFAFNAV